MNKEIEKAIEELKALRGICLYAEDGQQPSLKAIELAKVYDLAISTLEAQQADRWIPVEHGLPLHRYNEHGEPIEYIVMIRRATEPTTLSIDSHGKWYDAMGNYYNIASLMSYEWDVVAWHEMPTPWKEEQP